MTGGWKPFREEDFPKRWPPPPPVTLSAHELRVDEALESWRRCLRFRRRVKRAIGPDNLSFAEWQILRSTERLVRERDDPVSQQDVVRHCGLDVGTVSAAMRKMMVVGLVDVGPDAWGWQSRVLVTDKAIELLTRLEPVLSSLVESGYPADSLGAK